jgi:hypothetical protein
MALVNSAGKWRWLTALVNGATKWRWLRALVNSAGEQRKRLLRALFTRAL